MNEILLMTATINPKNTPLVSIASEQERLHQYLCSLLLWIKKSSIKTIVFCENSNTVYDFTPIIDLAKAHGKTLEVLVFDGNQESQIFGKGYGEGKILEHALNQSKFINDNTNFYKITGRLFVSNFELIRENHTEFSNIFNVPHWTQRNVNQVELMMRFSKRIFFTLMVRGLEGRKSAFIPNNNASTVFFKSNALFFKTYLQDVYTKVNDRWGYNLEMAYYDCLFGRDFISFKKDFHLVGRSGTTGELLAGLDYPSQIEILAKSYNKS